MANKPNNPSLWSKAKSLAKSKFDVYPSAYANGWAAKYYKSKGGTWRKGEKGMYMQDGGETPMTRKQKREAFREKVEEGSYDVYRKTNNPQVEKLSQRKTAENILSQSRSETGMGRAGKVKEASKATGWSKGEVRREVPTAFRKKVTNPLMSLINKPSSEGKSGVLKFPGLQGPSNCKGGGCLDMGSESTMKKGGMFKSKSKMKHGGSHSKLKQTYLNKYK